ncbi:phosphate signaling complex protein PhoU [Deltaproteobacteria bacterium OttesenSCG-928-M10]|nr:phosphate signaling complex protein PhoU [Deltaproteobacteria bacterium OttesenSCG-928-M10]
MQLLERELNNIRIKAASMSVTSGEMYQEAIRAFLNHDLALARQVVERDRLVDIYELEIDEMCLKFLALYAPKAMALRYVVAVLRMIVELERVADHSKAVCREVLDYHCASLLPGLPDFETMLNLTLKMLREATDSFFEKNAQLHEAIIETDKRVGRLQKALIHSLAALIRDDANNIDGAVVLMNIVRRVERVGDHAKNIAELVPYIASGQVVRHKEVLENANIDH